MEREGIHLMLTDQAVLPAQTQWDQGQGYHGLIQVIPNRIQDTTRVLQAVLGHGPEAVGPHSMDSVITRIGMRTGHGESPVHRYRLFKDTLWELRQRRVLAEHASRFKFLSNDNGARPKRARSKRACTKRAC